ncbi:ESX secretion-associated protein EspG [Nocardia aurantia]|uniref:ESX-1 secretion-associated protein EspG1 n=1 Tax=Nocardia aurantia TaxID=2585199 RepID=A0A7K0DH11_9NOCA|nr:ESX secretion-associated protein EspG [Nocardia aurantia]MQY24969.1 ESX-1 secretion-associated protein EspG1 [Nocardia aurantia]
MATLTTDGMLAVAAALGVQTFPTVLGVRSRHTAHADLVAARAAAVADLSGRGILDREGEVRDDELTAALFVLARPERQLVARIKRGDSLIRFCLARRGLEHGVAVRTGDDLEVSTVWAGDDPATLARPLLSVLGSVAPADVPPFSAPTEELRDRLDSAEVTEAVYGLGMPEADAVTLGLALRERVSTTELVCYSHHDGLAVRSAAAAAVYDTASGRIIGGGSVTADGRPWTTLAPGTDGRLAQVIASLVESLPEGRWMP